jgi:hypothetical protein
VSQSAAQQARNKLGGAARRHRTEPAHPEVVQARADLAAATLEDHIRDVVDGWPPLTPNRKHGWPCY